MRGNTRTVNEVTLEWEGRDWSGAGVRTSIMAVHRSSMASIGWKNDSLPRTQTLLITDRTATARMRLVKFVDDVAIDDMWGLCPKETWVPPRITPVTTPITESG
jgi:hypothetical protein